MTILHLPTTTSTMDVARKLIEDGDTTTSMVMADEQTASRGRHNRPWLTFGAPYSLQVTFILRPAPGPHLPLLVALALHEALMRYTRGQNLKIKWPNDILLNDQKLAGILCENIGKGTGQGASLVGIGLNIFAPETIPSTFQGTFLAETIPPETLANSILSCLIPRLALYQTEGWTKLLHKSYIQRCATIGQTIRWRVPQEGSNPAGNNEFKELTGYVRGLTPGGHLEMVEEDGTVHVIHSGEIFDKR